MEWNELTRLEQLSNIDGDVIRFIDAHERFCSGQVKKDYMDFYLDKICKFVQKTVEDPKNLGIEKELWDEVDEIRRYQRGEVDKEYILRYWNQYTEAIS